MSIVVRMELKFLRITALIATSFLAEASLGAAAPINDHFTQATKLELNQLMSVNLTDATVEDGEPFHSRFSRVRKSSAWYRFTPDFNGYVEFDTAGSSADSVLAVYTGPFAHKLTCLANCDNPNDNPSEETFDAKIRMAVTKGVRYSIALDSSYSNTNDMKIIVRPLIRHQTSSFEGVLRIANRWTASSKEDSGKLVVNLNSKGSVSGKLYAGSKSYPFATAITGDKTVPILVNRTGQLPVTLTLQLKTNATGDLEPEATVSGKMGDKSLPESWAYIAPKFTASNPCPRIGKYTFGVFASNASTFGVSICSFSVSNKGVAKGAGFLGDGTPFTWSAPVTNDNKQPNPMDLGVVGRMVIHKSLYRGKGQITSGISFDRKSDTSTRIHGYVDWFRPQSAKEFIRDGIDEADLAIHGHSFKTKTTGWLDSAFDKTSGSATFTATSPELNTVTAQFSLATTNKLTPPPNNPAGVKLSLNFKTGILTGSFKFNNQRYSSPVRAILLQEGSDDHVLPGFYGYNLTQDCGNPVSLIPE